MSASPLAEQLAPYLEGRAAPVSLDEARAYCRRLAVTHYENFTVASWLLPKRLRQHFYNVYAWCRWADDLADEARNPEESLRLLDWWEAQLDGCYAGQAAHPVLVALRETIHEFGVPDQPFRDLLTAFRRDQRQTHYETFDELLDYCRHSANPVGRLVLWLGRCHTDENAALSDDICTGLQLTNFWQDVARDFDKGRVYLPEEDRRRFGYDDAAIARRECNAAFGELMRFEVDRAEQFLRRGAALAGKVPRELRIDIELFAAGGLAVLSAIRRQRYDVWRRRPTVGRLAKLGLFVRAWRQSRKGGTL